jgi:hypothetical protein
LTQKRHNETKSLLSKISSEQAVSSAVLARTQAIGDAAKSDLGCFSASISEKTRNISSNPANSHITQVALLTEIKEQTTITEQTSREIKLAVQSLLENGNNGMTRLASLLQSALERAIPDRLESALKSMENSNSNRTESPDPSPFHQPDNTTTCPSSVTTGVSSLSCLSSTRKSRTWVEENKDYKFWFGRLHIRTSVTARWDSRTTSERLHRSQILETEITFLPSPWLFRKGASLSVQRIVSAFKTPQIQFNLQPLQVIAWDNPITKAMGSGNLSRVKFLIDSGQVHPLDVLPDGSTLLGKCLDELYMSLIPDDKDVWKKAFEDWDYIVERHSPDVIQKLTALVNMAKWLVQQGIESDSS